MRSNLAVSASVERKTGPDAIPPNKTYVTAIANAPFFLFDSDPADLLVKAGIKLERYESYGEDHRRALIDEYIASIAVLNETFGGSQYLRDYYARAHPVLRTHIIQTITTDSAGRGIFKLVPRGTYFVTGGKDANTWNINVEVPRPPLDLVLIR